MKKMILVAVVFVILFGVASYVEENYSMRGWVDSTANGFTTFEDSTGNLWDWEDEEGETWKMGEEVKLHFRTHGTTLRGDDTLKKITRVE